ncbi:hypothetical protein [Sphingomonas hylomeconis]|uniref:Carbohydrate kinase PfkB domain-containing protein n=1 Tax=Sphingomonas hylomeconis TaxID=1395958 RepID=A0ABV7SR94_9SPHN|nr:hypothetical protein [Sphingomonas hylomeconis]
MASIVAFGEGMIEIGGDTLNIAVALARLEHAPAYLTAAAAAVFANRVTAVTIGHAGAIPPRTAIAALAGTA